MARDGLASGDCSKRFALNGIKAWSDGSNQGGTGYMRQPYLNSSNRGALNYTPEEIQVVMKEAHDSGWQLGVHANGDGAIDVVLDAFAKVTEKEGATSCATGSSTAASCMKTKLHA
jgi:hypothetical protein